MKVRTSSDDTESSKSSIKDLLSIYLPILLPSLNKKDKPPNNFLIISIH